MYEVVITSHAERENSTISDQGLIVNFSNGTIADNPLC
jgi:hypothetical protein